MKWTRCPGGHLSEDYCIRKVHGWCPSTPRRNWVWEPHGPGVSVLVATHTLREAKALCEGASTRKVKEARP